MEIRLKREVRIRWSRKLYSTLRSLNLTKGAEEPVNESGREVGRLESRTLGHHSNFFTFYLINLSSSCPPSSATKIESPLETRAQAVCILVPRFFCAQPQLLSSERLLNSCWLQSLRDSKLLIDLPLYLSYRACNFMLPSGKDIFWKFFNLPKLLSFIFIPSFTGL